MDSVPLSGLRAVVGALDRLHVGEWSLDTIAEDIETDIRYGPCPGSMIAVVVIAERGAIVTVADWVRASRIDRLVRARGLAGVIAARELGLPLPRAGVLHRDMWRRDPERAPMWGAAIALCVSRADLDSVMLGYATVEQVAAHRGVPPWMIHGRFLADILCGRIEYDMVRALVDIRCTRARFLEWFDAQVAEHQNRVTR